jgi:Na+-driven multidrug efflux pump
MTFLLNIILITYTRAAELSATVFGVYFKLNSFVFMPVFGLNNGIIPIVAYNYGARNRRRMMEAIRLAVIYAASYILLGLLAFMIIPGPLLKIFNASDDMLRVGIPALRIIGSTFLFAGVGIAMSSVFQALGYGTYSMIVSFIRQLVVLLPAAYVLARVGMQTGNDTLVWYAFPIAEIASLITTLILYTRLYNNVIKPIPEGTA